MWRFERGDRFYRCNWRNGSDWRPWFDWSAWIHRTSWKHWTWRFALAWTLLTITFNCVVFVMLDCESYNTKYTTPYRTWNQSKETVAAPGRQGSQVISQGGGSSSQVIWPGAPWCSAATAKRGSERERLFCDVVGVDVLWTWALITQLLFINL